MVRDGMVHRNVISIDVYLAAACTRDSLASLVPKLISLTRQSPCGNNAASSERSTLCKAIFSTRC